jgi:methylated-DNA-[protein]-cysteine S-methyltransferase
MTLKLDVSNRYSAVYNTEIGKLRISSEGLSITEIKFAELASNKEGSGDNNTDEGADSPNAMTDDVAIQLKEYLAGERKEFDMQINPVGTEFQKKVWKALCSIPYGETRTYKQIAELIGNPKASRAVGMANNKNPIVVAVPCHRVIGANGKLVGYAGGLDIKEKLLELEK